MAERTPIKIRGKRDTSEAEMSNSTGARRSLKRLAACSQPTTAEKTVQRRRRATQRQPADCTSRLEKLPVEILHHIFLLSENLNLFAASLNLARSLQGQYLQLELSTRLLRRVLGRGDPSAVEGWVESSIQLHETRDILDTLDGGTASGVNEVKATRLLDCRFFTLQFFKSWIQAEFARLDQPLKKVWLHLQGGCREKGEKMKWLNLRPSTELMPPPKLLRSPFTKEKVEFLRYFEESLKYLDHGPNRLGPADREIVEEGLRQAVAERACATFGMFSKFAVGPQMELVQKAVIDYGCDPDVVRKLLRFAASTGGNFTDFRWNDPMLWRWATEAQLRGDEKGEWLKDQLSRCQEVKSFQSFREYAIFDCEDWRWWLDDPWLSEGLLTECHWLSWDPTTGSKDV